MDLRVGGELRVVMRNPHEDVEYGGGGRYTEIDPPRRLAFTSTADNLDNDDNNGRSSTAACFRRRIWACGGFFVSLRTSMREAV